MMSNEHSSIRHLKHRWDEEDAARDELEGQAKRAFLEKEAKHLFAPIEDHLTKLGTVLLAAQASVEVNPIWEHLGEQKLRRIANVILSKSAHHLPLDFTIEGATIFYRNRAYRFTAGVEALIPVITSDVEQYISAQTRGEGQRTSL